MALCAAISSDFWFLKGYEHASNVPRLRQALYADPWILHMGFTGNSALRQAPRRFLGEIMICFVTFTEDDIRHFSPSDSMLSAINAVRSGIADGMCVDLISDSGDVLVSHEVSGNGIISWYGDDLHE